MQEDEYITLDQLSIQTGMPRADLQWFATCEKVATCWGRNGELLFNRANVFDAMARRLEKWGDGKPKTRHIATIGQMCVITGLTRPALLRLARKGLIPSMSFGAVWIFDPDAVVEALRERSGFTPGQTHTPVRLLSLRAALDLFPWEPDWVRDRVAAGEVPTFEFGEKTLVDVEIARPILERLFGSNLKPVDQRHRFGEVLPRRRYPKTKAPSDVPPAPSITPPQEHEP